MNEKQISYILRNKSWPEDAEERTDRLVVYLVPFALSFFVVIFLSIGEQIYYFVGFGLIPIIVLLYKFLHKRLNRANEFFELDIPPEGRQKVVPAMKKIGWTIFEEKENYVKARTDLSWFSWGEHITIVFGADVVLFNCKPNKQVITFNPRELTNKKKLIHALKES